MTPAVLITVIFKTRWFAPSAGAVQESTRAELGPRLIQVAGTGSSAHPLIRYFILILVRPECGLNPFTAGALNVRVQVPLRRATTLPSLTLHTLFDEVTHVNGAPCCVRVGRLTFFFGFILWATAAIFCGLPEVGVIAGLGG